jgi:uncharacterized protein YybS (DUF2232 family)
LTDNIPIKEIFLPVAVTLVIFFVSLLFPPLGIVIGVFSPVPLVWIYLRGGKQIGLVCLVVACVIILFAFGVRYALFFMAEYGVMAFILGETVRFRLPIEKCIVFTALGSAFMSAVVLSFAFSTEEVSLEEFIQEQVQVHVKQSAETFKSMGNKPEDQAAFEKILNRIAELLAVAYPSFIFVGSLFGALVNYSVSRYFWRRQTDAYPFFEEKFNSWVLQENFIWAFIASAGIAWFVPEGSLFGIGINGLIVCLAVYVLQGLAIAFHFLESKSVPKFLWVLLVAFVFSQPVLIGLLIGLGVFDLWADFRKLKVVEASPQDYDEDQN